MKKCPYCAEQIQDEAIKCRYCGSMLNGAPAGPGAGGSAEALQGEVRALLAQREKIAAIKLVRERTGTGLLEAKNYVDALDAGVVPILPRAASAGRSGDPTSPTGAGGGLARGAMFLGMVATAIAIYLIFSHRP